MRKFILMFVISSIVSGVQAQELKIVSYQEFEKLLAVSPEKPKVINFWATWCKPCIEEIPFFTTVQEQLKDRDLEFVFVSLDFMSQTTKVKEMIEKLKISGTLLQLQEKGGDWIDSFDKNWSGAIPYTVLFLPNGEKREHYDVFHSFDDLKTFLDNNLTN